ARLLVALRREYPDRFGACLALRDAMGQKADRRTGGAEEAQPDSAGGTANWFPEDGPSRRLKRVKVQEATLFAYLKEKGFWLFNPPADPHVVGSEVDTSQRELCFFIRW